MRGWLALSAAAASASAAAPRVPPPALPAGYQVSLPAELELDQGAAGSVSLTIAAEPGYTISQSGPLRVALAADPPDGLELPRRRYQRAQAADRLAASPRFDLAVRGARAGRYRLAVDLLFWLCRGRTCRPIQTGRAVAIAVRAPAAGREDHIPKTRSRSGMYCGPVVTMIAAK